MLLMAPLGGEISRGTITLKALMDSTIPGASAGALLFRGGVVRELGESAVEMSSGYQACT